MVILPHQIHIDRQFQPDILFDVAVQYTAPHRGLNWYGRVVTVGDAQAILLLLDETGYFIFLHSLSSVPAIELAVCWEVDSLLPMDSILDVAGTSRNCTWHCVESYPDLVLSQFEVATALIGRCRGADDARDAITALNQTRLNGLDRSGSPQDALKALLTDIIDKFRHYTQTAHPMVQQWHRLTGKQPWLSPDYAVAERRWL